MRKIFFHVAAKSKLWLSVLNYYLTGHRHLCLLINFWSFFLINDNPMCALAAVLYSNLWTLKQQWLLGEYLNWIVLLKELERLFPTNLWDEYILYRATGNVWCSDSNVMEHLTSDLGIIYVLLLQTWPCLALMYCCGYYIKFLSEVQYQLGESTLQFSRHRMSIKPNLQCKVVAVALTFCWQNFKCA